MRNLILFLLPAITFAQTSIELKKSDYNEALSFTNLVRSYYGYDYLNYDSNLSDRAVEAAVYFMENDGNINDRNVLVFKTSKYENATVETYIADAVVAWAVDDQFGYRIETLKQIVDEQNYSVAFGVVETDEAVCVTAKFNE